MITKGGQYAMLAARFRLEAESLLASTTVEINVNGDGFGEVPINFSSHQHALGLATTDARIGGIGFQSGPLSIPTAIHAHRESQHLIHGRRSLPRSSRFPPGRGVPRHGNDCPRRTRLPASGPARQLPDLARRAAGREAVHAGRGACLRWTPMNTGEEFKTPDTMAGDLLINCEIVIRGSCCDDLTNFWWMLTRCFYPKLIGGPEPGHPDAADGRGPQRPGALQSARLRPGP